MNSSKYFLSVPANELMSIKGATVFRVIGNFKISTMVTCTFTKESAPVDTERYQILKVTSLLLLPISTYFLSLFTGLKSKPCFIEIPSNFFPNAVIFSEQNFFTCFVVFPPKMLWSMKVKSKSSEIL